jgi:hypothetical protein
MPSGLPRKLGAVWRRVKAWFQRPRETSRQPRRKRPSSPQYRIAYVDDTPEHIEPKTIYAVGADGHLWHLAFTCPCGCGAPVALNLLPDDEPRWSFEDELGAPTIVPSVERRTGCRSHYFITDGEVRWVRTDPRYGRTRIRGTKVTSSGDSDD